MNYDTKASLIGELNAQFVGNKDLLHLKVAKNIQNCPKNKIKKIEFKKSA